MSNPVPASEVKNGDFVKVQFKVDDDFFTIEGKAREDSRDGDLIVAGWVIAHANGNPGPYQFCVIERTPAEPPVGSMILDCDGDYWAHVPDGWVLIKESASRHAWRAVGGEYDFEVVTA